MTGCRLAPRGVGWGRKRGVGWRRLGSSVRYALPLLNCHDYVVATPMDCTINLVFAMAAHLKFELFVADCTQAFLQPPKPSNISLYGKLPTDCKIPGFCNGGEIVEFLKLLYGCKQSGRVWQVWLDDHILGFTKKGFKIKKSVKDQCLYLVFSGERLALMILVMVDDILGAGPKDLTFWTDTCRTSRGNPILNHSGNVTRVLHFREKLPIIIQIFLIWG